MTRNQCRAPGTDRNTRRQSNGALLAASKLLSVGSVTCFIWHCISFADETVLAPSNKVTDASWPYQLVQCHSVPGVSLKLQKQLWPSLETDNDLHNVEPNHYLPMREESDFVDLPFLEVILLPVVHLAKKEVSSIPHFQCSKLWDNDLIDLMILNWWPNHEALATFCFKLCQDWFFKRLLLVTSVAAKGVLVVGMSRVIVKLFKCSPHQWQNRMSLNIPTLHLQWNHNFLFLWWHCDYYWWFSGLNPRWFWTLYLPFASSGGM